MHSVVQQAFHDELEKIAFEKQALLERLVRLGATDIPGTPRMFMRKRSPQELAALQETVESGWAKRVTSPIMRFAEKGLKRLPKGKVQDVARKGAKLIAEDPITGAVALTTPGGSVVPFAKRGLEKLIDRLAPLSQSKA